METPYEELKRWVIKRQNTRICLACGGSKGFASSIVRWTYYCNKCDRIWTVVRKIEIKNPKPIILYTNPDKYNQRRNQTAKDKGESLTIDK